MAASISQTISLVGILKYHIPSILYWASLPSHSNVTKDEKKALKPEGRSVAGYNESWERGFFCCLRKNVVQLLHLSTWRKITVRKGWKGIKQQVSCPQETKQDQWFNLSQTAFNWCNFHFHFLQSMVQLNIIKLATLSVQRLPRSRSLFQL